MSKWLRCSGILLLSLSILAVGPNPGAFAAVGITTENVYSGEETPDESLLPGIEDEEETELFQNKAYSDFVVENAVFRDLKLPVPGELLVSNPEISYEGLNITSSWEGRTDSEGRVLKGTEYRLKLIFSPLPGYSLGSDFKVSFENYAIPKYSMTGFGSNYTLIGSYTTPGVSELPPIPELLNVVISNLSVPTPGEKLNTYPSPQSEGVKFINAYWNGPTDSDGNVIHNSNYTLSMKFNTLPGYNFHDNAKFIYEGITGSYSSSMMRVMNDVTMKLTFTTPEAPPVITMEERSEEEEIPFETEYIDDSSIEFGKETIKVPGKTGLAKNTYNDIFHNGIFNHSELKESLVIIEPVRQVVIRGTKENKYTKERTEIKEVPFETVYKDSSEIFEGLEEVETEGQSGIIHEIYIDTYINDQLESSELKETKEIRKPTDRIILRGIRNPEGNTDIRMGYAEETIEYQTIKVSDPTIPSGVSTIKTPGVNGLMKVTYWDTYVDGEIVSREEINREIIKEAVNEVILVGSSDETNNSGEDSIIISDSKTGVDIAFSSLENLNETNLSVEVTNMTDGDVYNIQLTGSQDEVFKPLYPVTFYIPYNADMKDIKVYSVIEGEETELSYITQDGKIVFAADYIAPFKIMGKKGSNSIKPVPNSTSSTSTSSESDTHEKDKDKEKDTNPAVSSTTQKPAPSENETAEVTSSSLTPVKTISAPLAPGKKEMLPSTGSEENFMLLSLGAGLIVAGLIVLNKRKAPK